MEQDSRILYFGAEHFYEQEDWVQFQNGNMKSSPRGGVSTLNPLPSIAGTKALVGCIRRHIDIGRLCDIESPEVCDSIVGV